jgi:hypothetical protein
VYVLDELGACMHGCSAVQCSTGASGERWMILRRTQGNRASWHAWVDLGFSLDASAMREIGDVVGEVR